MTRATRCELELEGVLSERSNYGPVFIAPWRRCGWRCAPENRSAELSDSTTILEFIMCAVVARCFSECSGRRTRTLDGSSTREEDVGQTTALDASAAASRPLLRMLAAVCESNAPNLSIANDSIRNLSDAARRTARICIRPGAGRGALSVGRLSQPSRKAFPRVEFVCPVCAPDTHPEKQPETQDDLSSDQGLEVYPNWAFRPRGPAGLRE